eukprot:CAMPEP_0113444538 /NCGR_PEP_ID=MMETSP0014_2-20120614/2716_1 /TAXON_ID=2857 /ORGANISM="Nitzschia sp." /LENGTH=870 /DNA_ID=CAMNT_0000335549 /DNA_START=214 /DNA_END=2826 /DNA_ORIENTATION=+ /assembly_acc=CAM_ASM_000159
MSQSHAPISPPEQQHAPGTPRTEEKKVSVMTLLQRSPLSANSQNRKLNMSLSPKTKTDKVKQGGMVATNADSGDQHRPNFEDLEDRDTLSPPSFSTHPIKTIIINKTNTVNGGSKGSRNRTGTRTSANSYSTDISNHTGETADETETSRGTTDDYYDRQQHNGVIGKWISSPSSVSPTSTGSPRTTSLSRIKEGSGSDGNNNSASGIAVGVVEIDGIPTELNSPLNNNGNNGHNHKYYKYYQSNNAKQQQQDTKGPSPQQNREMDTTMSSQQSPLSLPTVDLFGSSDHSTYSFAGDYGMNRDRDSSTSNENGGGDALALEYSTGSMSFNSNFRADVSASLGIMTGTAPATDEGSGNGEKQRPLRGVKMLSSQKLERTESFVNRRNKRLEMLKNRSGATPKRRAGKKLKKHVKQKDGHQAERTNTDGQVDEEGHDPHQDRLQKVIEEESTNGTEEGDHSSTNDRSTEYFKHGSTSSPSPPTPNQSPLHTPNRAELRQLIVDSYATLSPLSPSNDVDGDVTSPQSRSLSHADGKSRSSSYHGNHGSPNSQSSRSERKDSRSSSMHSNKASGKPSQEHKPMGKNEVRSLSPRKKGSSSPREVHSPTKLSPISNGRSSSLPPSPSKSKDKDPTSPSMVIVPLASPSPSRKNSFISASSHSRSNSTSGSSRHEFQIMRLEDELDGANGIITHQQEQIVSLQKDMEDMKLRFEQAKQDHDVQLRLSRAESNQVTQEKEELQRQLDDARARIQELEGAEKNYRRQLTNVEQPDHITSTAVVAPVKKHRPGQVDTDEIYTQSPLFHGRRHSIGGETMSNMIPLLSLDNSTSNRSHSLNQRISNNNSKRALPHLSARQNQSHQASFPQAAIHRSEGCPR